MTTLDACSSTGWSAAVSRSYGGGAVLRPAGQGRVPVHYVRTGPTGGAAPPIVLVPGGPGIASVLPYRGVRRRAAARGLDVVMMEHRGVGLSRRDDTGTDLAVEQVTVEATADDLAAVLDDAGIAKAVVLGSSYGTYLAQAFGVRHPDRVAGMVLDSPILSVADDLPMVRAHARRLLWDGDDPATARCAELLRGLVAEGTVTVAETGRVVPVVYEFGGPEVLERLLSALSRGQGLRSWRLIAGLGVEEVGPGTPYVYEPDLVSGIAFGALGYGLPPDGLPLDPQSAFTEAARHAPAYAGEPFHLPSEITRFRWPTAVVSGDRDLRTPSPIAERVASLIPDSCVVAIPGMGHSALDTHPIAALNIVDLVARGHHRDLPALAPRIAALPRRGASRLIGPVISGLLSLDVLLPG
ncbi:alpha/beta hydrolase family protein [Pseudonocardia sediminis]|uniref:Alpha/beta hydrolase family protein n=1 Tax=Pseudonocardia sediminis TaxID=1397368 RepID=A0A4Q7V1Q6_PSEST|nr:alpha/beta fold hydrolase [Pseudonocardia sediminis]RZT87368.1 alpha/beta hydrolase family protein [Pseudonocardia sediminis]